MMRGREGNSSHIFYLFSSIVLLLPLTGHCIVPQHFPRNRKRQMGCQEREQYRFYRGLKLRRVNNDKSNSPADAGDCYHTTTHDPRERPAGPTTASYGQIYIVPKMKSTASRRQT